MNLKTLGLAISLLSAGWLSAANATSITPKLNNDDTLSINSGSFQLNAATGTLPTGETAGAADGLYDVLFGAGLPKISVNNRVINKNGSDVVPGITGDFAVGSSSGGFQAYEGMTGEITSFDGSEFGDLSEVNGGFDQSTTPGKPSSLFNNNFLLRLGKDTGNDLYFYLTKATTLSPIDSILQDGDPFVLLGEGWLAAKNDSSEVAYYKVSYTFTSQSLSDDKYISNNPVLGDGVTGVTSYSGAAMVVTIVPQSTVPEPSAIVGLSVVAGAGLLMKKKKLVQDK